LADDAILLSDPAKNAPNSGDGVPLMFVPCTAVEMGYDIHHFFYTSSDEVTPADGAKNYVPYAPFEYAGASVLNAGALLSDA
jgi:hypothetical protein